MDKEATIIDEKQIIIDKSDLDFIHKQYKDKIADLEAKLAESENFYKDLGFKDEKDARDYLIDCITQPKDLVKDVRQLKQQLVETDKLMQEYLSKCLSLEQQLAEKEKEGTKRMEDFEKRCQEYYKSNQTAIAELNNILDTFAIFVNEEKESLVSLDGSGNLSLLEYIESRIDTLKGGANE